MIGKATLKIMKISSKKTLIYKQMREINQAMIQGIQSKCEMQDVIK